MSLSLRLWRAPMKSQVKRSPQRPCFASSSWARFSPTSSMPPSASAGSSSASRYLIAASTSTSAPIFSRTRSRFSRTRFASGIEHCQPGLAPGASLVAAVREVEVRPAARAVVDLLDLLDAARCELLRDDLSQVEHSALGDAVVVRELLEHLLADLEAALADARSDSGGRGALEAREGPRDDAAGDPPPAAVQHGHAAASG